MTLPPNPAPRPTPLTDHAIMNTHWEGTSVNELVRADFARQLERDRGELIDHAKWALSELNKWHTSNLYFNTRCVELRSLLSRLTKTEG